MVPTFSRDDCVHVDVLIREIKIRPALYDSTLKEYTDVEVRRKLWEEVSEKVFSAIWGQLSDEEKEKARKKVQTRYKNLRSCFRRELREQKSMLEQHARKSHKYKFYNKLKFLLPFLQDGKSSGNIELVVNGEDCEKSENGSRIVKHKKISNFRERLLKIIPEKKETVCADSYEDFLEVLTVPHPVPMPGAHPKGCRAGNQKEIMSEVPPLPVSMPGAYLKGCCAGNQKEIIFDVPPLPVSMPGARPKGCRAGNQREIIFDVPPLPVPMPGAHPKGCRAENQKEIISEVPPLPVSMPGINPKGCKAGNQKEIISEVLPKKTKIVFNDIDPEEHFVLSLLPMLKALPVHLKLEAQIQILRVFQTIHVPPSPGMYSQFGHINPYNFAVYPQINYPLPQSNTSNCSHTSDSSEASEGLDIKFEILENNDDNIS